MRSQVYQNQKEVPTTHPTKLPQRRDPPAIQGVPPAQGADPLETGDTHPVGESRGEGLTPTQNFA